MIKQFNQQCKHNLKKVPLKWLIICSISLLFTSFTISQNDYILKVDKKLFQGTIKSYITIGQRIVGDFPCGEAIGISLQDVARYIFSSASPFNATLAPGLNHEILLPDDGGNKTFNNNPMSYTESFKRINNLEVGIIEGYYGQRWAIAAQQLQQQYATSVFDIQLEGKEEVAFDYGNLFHEMLISIQQLSKQNELLKDRLASIEDQLNRPEDPRMLNGSNKTNQVEITPNPNKGQIIIHYQLDDEVKNAALMLTDMVGRTMQRFKLNTTSYLQVEELNLSAGVYLYHLVYDGQQTEGQKLIVQ